MWPWAVQTSLLEVEMDKVIGKGVVFERIRRITGYLVGKLERFNSAKRSEVADRVQHMGRQDKGC